VLERLLLVSIFSKLNQGKGTRLTLENIICALLLSASINEYL
jgi:hypothetical protein